MKIKCVSLAILISGCLGCSVFARPASKGLFITDDFGGVIKCKTPSDLDRFCNTLLSASPDMVALDAAIPDVCYYPTEVGYYLERENHREMLAAGIDPYGYVAGKIKASKTPLIANIRMNDHHGNLEFWTPWAQEHKHWSLGKDTGDRGWTAVGMLRRMDYAIEGVCDYRLAIIKEIINRYDVDGIQLDFGRTAPFLSEPKNEKAKYLTAFVKSVRELLNDASAQNSSSKKLGVVVPWDLEYCTNEGMDVGQWINDEIVDYICPGEFYYSDYNVDFTVWDNLRKGTKVKFYPMLLGDMAPHRVPGWAFQKGNMPILGDSPHLTEPRISAFAELYYSQGADGIMFYNFYTFNFGRFYPILRGLVDPVRIPTLPRQYWTVKKTQYSPSEEYTFWQGKPFVYDTLNDQDDVICQTFRFGSKIGQNSAVLRFKMKYAGRGDAVQAVLNGRPIRVERADFVNFTDREDNSYEVAVWQGNVVDSTMIVGENKLCILLIEKDSGREKPMGVGEFEVMIHPTNHK